MKYILIALLSLAIFVTAAIADNSRVIIQQLQSDVQQLRTDFDRTRKGGTRMVFVDYDIETALAYIRDKDTEGLLRYCQNNDLDYNKLIDLLIDKGFVRAGEVS
jgi:outer membrane lipoprotein-sorting protein